MEFLKSASNSSLIALRHYGIFFYFENDLSSKVSSVCDEVA